MQALCRRRRHSDGQSLRSLHRRRHSSLSSPSHCYPIHQSPSGCSWPRYVLRLSHLLCPARPVPGAALSLPPRPSAPTANNHLSSRFESPAPGSRPKSQRVAYAPAASNHCDCYALVDGIHRSLFWSSVRPELLRTVVPAAFPGRANQKQPRNDPAPAPTPLSVTLAATHPGTTRRTFAPMSSTDRIAF